MEILGLETLSDLRDGALKEVFNAEMQKIYKDCDDRPHVAAARTLTLKITITPDKPPKMSAVNNLEGVEVGFSVGSTFPAQSLSRKMKASHKKKGFGFETDTDSTEPADEQRKLPGEK